MPATVTQRQELERLVAAVELFRTPEGAAHATFGDAGRRETAPVTSKAFRQWLLVQHDKAHPNKLLGRQTLIDTIERLEARACRGDAVHPVFLRVARHGGACYLDLASDAREVIEITPQSWRIVPAAEAPVRFCRTRGMQPLPRPEQDGTLDDLRPFLNIEPDDFILVLAWLIAAVQGGGPFPILMLQGEPGSAKTTTTRVLRALVDPSTMPARALSRDARELFLAAKNNWILAFDNLSGLPGWASDALCQLATGGGFAARKLYADDEETLYQVQRPLILNGIDEIASRYDLLDRALILITPVIAPDRRRDEHQFWSAFEQARPRLLGALLDTLSATLRQLPGITLPETPRLADFARLGTAMSAARGEPERAFLDAWTRQRREALDAGLETDLVAQAVTVFANEHAVWTGTTAELLAALAPQAAAYSGARGWPHTPNALGHRLNRLMPALRERGITIEKSSGRRHGRILTISAPDPAPAGEVRRILEKIEEYPPAREAGRV